MIDKIISFFKKLFGLTPKLKKYHPFAIGQTQAWYGRVNYWPISHLTTTKELNAMAKAGVAGYMIEMAGWAGSTGKQWTDAWIKDVEKEYNWILDECRDRNLYLFVSVVNDNMGKGKYGDTGPTLDKVYSTAQKLVGIIKKAGSKGVFVQPVAETGTSTGKKFESYTVSELKGFNLVYNGNGGHPSGPAGGMGFFAVHPAKISESVPKAALVISDHGLIIRELNIGGKLEGHGDPAKVTKWASNVKVKGSPVCGYYAFKVQDFDGDTIKALGSVLK